MTKERIDEIARKIDGCFQRPDITFVWQAAAEVLGMLPEFQAAPKSAWVQCSERMPPNEQIEFLAKPSRDQASAPVVACGNYICRSRSDFIAWTEIPPYVPPESELVRRLTPKLTPEALAWVKLYEKEIADGK